MVLALDLWPSLVILLVLIFIHGVASCVPYLAVVFLIKIITIVQSILKSISNYPRDESSMEKTSCLHRDLLWGILSPSDRATPSFNRGPNSEYKVLNFITVTLI